MVQVDAALLRGLLDGLLNTGTHADITKRFEALGLCEPRTEPGQVRSKAQRVELVLATAPVEELRRIAEVFLANETLNPALRNAIQDVLWAEQGPRIWERARRTLAAALDIDDVVVDCDRFEALLDRWWVLGEPSPFEGIFASSDVSMLAQVFGPGSGTDRLRKEIHQHVFRNRDWSTVQLFEKLGAFDAVDRRFLGFVEELASYRVVVEEDRQRRIVGAVAPALREIGMEMREVGVDNGYPEFRIVSTTVPRIRPKTVIFGSEHNPTCESVTPS